MTSKDINTGGPAFPCQPSETARKQCEAVGVAYYAPTGMTLRDYFAAKAMQGFAVNLGPGVTFESRATIAYQWADAMLKARND